MKYTNEHLPTMYDMPLVSSKDNRRTVLLVDDDAKLLRALTRQLAYENYNLLTAVSPAEARVLLSKHCVDLILSDNLMVGELGTSFLADVRRDYPHMKMMILSGYMPAAVAQKALSEIGVLKVLVKPCQSGEVLQSIRDALEGPEGTNVR